MFVIGNGINAGMAGRRPSLTDLDKGDLEYTTDSEAPTDQSWNNGLAQTVNQCWDGRSRSSS